MKGRPDKSLPQTPREAKRAGMSPKKKAAFLWLVAFFVIAMSIFVYVTPASYRIRVVVASLIVAPWTVWSLFYVLRDD